MNQFRCNKSKFRLELSDVLILYNGLKPKNYQQRKHTYKPMRLLHVSWKIPSLIHRFVMFKRRLEYIIDLSSFLELNVSVLLKLVHVSLWMWSQSLSFFCLKQSNQVSMRVIAGYRRKKLITASLSWKLKSRRIQSQSKVGLENYREVLRHSCFTVYWNYHKS